MMLELFSWAPRETATLTLIATAQHLTPAAFNANLRDHARFGRLYLNAANEDDGPMSHMVAATIGAACNRRP